MNSATNFAFTQEGHPHKMFCFPSPSLSCYWVSWWSKKYNNKEGPGNEVELGCLVTKSSHGGLLRWPIGSTSASHQCGPGSIPGLGSDPGAVTEKGLSSLA